MSTPTRVRRGVPTGGQFATRSHVEAETTLTGIAPAGIGAPVRARRTRRTDTGWQPPNELPDSAVLHPRADVRTDRDGNVEAVWCARCGADIEDYDDTEAIESGADLCEQWEQDFESSRF